MIIRSYTDLIKIPTFEGRFEYLKLNGRVGEDTFGFDRYLNQSFYRSDEWRRLRNYIIKRDLGCDLGIPDREISGRVYVHHMNPITAEDILKHSAFLVDPDFFGVYIEVDTRCNPLWRQGFIRRRLCRKKTI